jgi:hypothetical protein
MNNYEIRIVPKDGRALIYDCARDGDFLAVEYGMRLASDDAMVEVWRGMDCVFRRFAIRLQATPPSWETSVSLGAAQHGN